MKTGESSNSVCLILTTIFLFLAITPNVYGSFLYKSYIIRYDKGWDVLCDPYVVKRNDWVYKLFKQKGEISHRDFPEFIRIFKRLNPHINDIDVIRPGQQIVIPLKKLKKDTLTGQSSGIVTIPFVTFSSMPETVETYSTKHKVRQRDCLSILISRKFGAFGAKSYNEGIKLFRLFNPDVVDIDLIYQGQTIIIPDPSIRKRPWYGALFDGSGKNFTKKDLNGFIQPDSNTKEPLAHEDEKEIPDSFLSKSASVLNAKLLDKGFYYFPGQGDKDFKLDLSRFPVIELKDGKKILFADKNNFKESDLNAVKNYWSNLKVVSPSSDLSVQQILGSVLHSTGQTVLKNRLSFSDQGIDVEVRAQYVIDQHLKNSNNPLSLCITLIDSQDEATQDSICRYLEQKNILIKDSPKEKKSVNQQPDLLLPEYAGDVITLTFLESETFVKNLLKAMNYNYTQNIDITFPYAGIQVRAVSNLIQRDNKIPILVDFGDLYGDAVLAIENTGFKVIQITNDDNVNDIVKKFLTKMGIPFTVDPTFLAAKRAKKYNTSITIPGLFAVNSENHKTLFTTVSVHYEIVGFLKKQGVKTVLIN